MCTVPITFFLLYCCHIGHKQELEAVLSYHPCGVQQVSSCCLAPPRPPPAPPEGCASYRCQPLWTPSSLDPRDLQPLQSQDAPPPAAVASQNDAHPWGNEGNGEKLHQLSDKQRKTSPKHYNQLKLTSSHSRHRFIRFIQVQNPPKHWTQPSTVFMIQHHGTPADISFILIIRLLSYRSSQLWLRCISRTLRPKPTSTSSILLW